MKRRILLAFDESDNAMRAVEFVAEAFRTEHEIILFSVIPDTAAMCDLSSPGLTPYFLSQRSVFCTLEDQKKSLVTEAAQSARELLARAGFGADQISVKVVARHKSVARDILDEAEADGATIVMGRRGLSGLQEMLLGSVSQKVLHLARGVTVVVVE